MFKWCKSHTDSDVRLVFQLHKVDFLKFPWFSSKKSAGLSLFMFAYSKWVSLL